MRALVVYESMYGNTHIVADRIALGLGPSVDVHVASVHDVSPPAVALADVLLVGGPTHVHSVPTTSAYGSGREAVPKPRTRVEPENDTEGPCVRRWFETLGPLPGVKAAAFDTRISGSQVRTGRASKGIEVRLAALGCVRLAPGESFCVDLHNQLLEGEADRAEAWGRSLARLLTSPSTHRLAQVDLDG